jgi:hypothetical protein
LGGMEEIRNKIKKAEREEKIKQKDGHKKK